MLIDTDVLIWYMRGNEKAYQAVENSNNFLSHSMQLADALIGATAIAYGFPILTGNDKHYKVMKDLEIKKFVP